MYFLNEQIRKLFINYLVIVLLFAVYSCTEPYEGSVEGFEVVLVVNAIITNENKKQEIRLTKSYRFEENGPTAEENAIVSISDGEGQQIAFEEIEPGKYVTMTEFAATMNRTYSLSITTENGRSYRSDTMQLPKASTTIDEVFAERTVDHDGVEGIAISIDTFDPSRGSNYYRYEYIETYKIIAPLWSPEDVVLVIQLSTGPEFNTILREREEHICYGNDQAKTINVVNTVNLSEDRLDRYIVRFIKRDNYILSHRYSILVRQYVESPEAFAYYEVLKGLTQSSTDVFSEDQPGFLAGNIFSLDDPNENVVGFFEVAAVAEKRLFLSYEDFFPGEELPPFIQNCMLTVLGGNDLADAIKNGTIVYFDSNGGIRTTSRACGDCTALGSNKVPDFWVE